MGEEDVRRSRLRRVLAAEGLGGGEDAVLLPSDSNDAWRVGPLVVRICWRGDLGRMAREARILQDLPPEVGGPQFVSAGAATDLAWTVLRWVEGGNLAEVWPRLDRNEQRRAIARVAEMLTALHGWTPSPSAARALSDDSPINLADPGDVIGASIYPLPLERTFALAEHAHELPFVGRDLVARTAERLRQLAKHDPYAGPGADPRQHVPIHGDVSLGNLVWRDGRVAALLDFEWIRPGPRNLELEDFLRSVGWSGLDPERIPVEEMARFLGWLAEDYSLLFAGPELLEQLWLYQLSYAVRALYTQPLDGPATQASPDHPINALPMFLRGTDHLERVLAAIP